VRLKGVTPQPLENARHLKYKSQSPPLKWILIRDQVILQTNPTIDNMSDPQCLTDPAPPSKPTKSTCATEEPKPITLTTIEDPLVAASSDSTPLQAAAGVSPTFHTHVQVFLLSTGDDSGSECELEGWIRFPDSTRNPPGLDFERDFPIKSSWAGENGGLGRQLFEYTASRVGLPLGFNVQVYEDDTAGLDFILTYSMDFARPENAQYWNGGVWTLGAWNTEDNRYRINLWWQVTT